jgi:hypothetical protein
MPRTLKILLPFLIILSLWGISIYIHSTDQAKKTTPKISDTSEKSNRVIYDHDDSIILAQVGNSYFIDSGYSKISLRPGTTQGTSITRSYHIIDYYYQYSPNGGYSLKPKLVVETKKRISNGHGNHDDILDSIHFSVWSVWETITKKDWSKTIRAEDVSYKDVIDVVLPQRSGSNLALTHESYRINDGSLMMQYNGTFYKIEVDASAKYLGFVSKLEYGSMEGDTTSVLTLADAANNESQKLILVLKRLPKSFEEYRYGEAPTATIKLLPQKTIDIKNYDGGDKLKLNSKIVKYSDTNFTDFKIQITFKGWIKTTIVVPVKHGKFDIHSLHSEWFDFRLED